MISSKNTAKLRVENSFDLIPEIPIERVNSNQLLHYFELN